MPRLGVRQVYVIGQAGAKYMHPVAMNVVDFVGFIFSGLIVIEPDITSFVYERHLYNDIGSHLLGFSLLHAIRLHTLVVVTHRSHHNHCRTTSG